MSRGILAECSRCGHVGRARLGAIETTPRGVVSMLAFGWLIGMLTMAAWCAR